MYLKLIINCQTLYLRKIKVSSNSIMNQRTFSSKSQKVVSSSILPSSSRDFLKTETTDEGNIEIAKIIKIAKTDNYDGEKIAKNPSNIQMISDELHKQIFIGIDRKTEEEKISPELLNKCISTLDSFSLNKNNTPIIKPVKFQLPKLLGNSIEDHFKIIASEQIAPYKKLLDELIKNGIPKQPKEWAMKSGWTKYDENNRQFSVPYPEEDGLVFDVETCVPNGPLPVMACAVSTKYWYSWCSTDLIENRDRNPNDDFFTHDLIPFQEFQVSQEHEEKQNCKEKLIVGHNVSFDRSRICDEYTLNGTKTRFIDTMSLHIAVSGITSYQRALKVTFESRNSSGGNFGAGGLEWNALSSLNNLKDVHKLYCDSEKEVKKEPRNIFITGNISEIRENFQYLMEYCANDVEATHSILVKIMPKFYKRFPYSVTLSGMFEMGSAYLPINANWKKYIKKSQETFDGLEKEMKKFLMEKAEDALKLLYGEQYKKDPWLWDLDWKITKTNKKGVKGKQYPAWYKKLLYKDVDPDYQEGPAKISTSMRIVPKLLRLTWMGFPLYYSKTGGWGYLIKRANINKIANSTNKEEEDGIHNFFHDEEEEEDNPFPYKEWEEYWDKSVINLTQIIKKDNNQQSLTTAGNSKKEGKATNIKSIESKLIDKREESIQEIADFLKGLDVIEEITFSKTKKASSTKKINNSHSPHPNLEFRQLPHKDGGDKNVGNPLAKDFLAKIEDGILGCANTDSSSTSSGGVVANKVVRLSKMVSYWRNNCDRINGQITIWNSPECKEGAILPQITVSGTLTRRAVEPTWLTASNAYEDRVGSELKAMIQVPPDYNFVGADVDSQELWIASVVGDAHFGKFHGSTPLGWMTLQGNKADGTDMHSKTASFIGIDREQAKILNYGRIYGAGVNFAERLLRQFNQKMSGDEAKNKAKAMYKMTKGERKYLLNEEGLELASTLLKNKNVKDLDKRAFSRSELYTLTQINSNSGKYSDIVEKRAWDGGTESSMFNRLEEIAQSECPKTPFLQCSISRSLVPSVVRDEFMTSRVNWVVQSSAVDYLHLMLTCMKWLIDKYKIQARFSISVHDEVRYIVKTEDRYRAALALQITNLFTRAMCSYQLGIYDLPQAVAFFSLVDIDKVLRKEVDHECKTPSNPLGLHKGYNIPFGESLDINQILKLTNNDNILKI